MRLVKWTDDNGYRRAALVKNDGTETDGPHGIAVAPPDLERIDWESCRKQIQNALVDSELFSWQDIQLNQQKFQSALALFRRWVVSLYREGGNGEQ